MAASFGTRASMGVDLSERDQPPGPQTRPIHASKLRPASLPAMETYGTRAFRASGPRSQISFTSRAKHQSCKRATGKAAGKAEQRSKEAGKPDQASRQLQLASSPNQSQPAASACPGRKGRKLWMYFCSGICHSCRLSNPQQQNIWTPLQPRNALRLQLGGPVFSWASWPQ